MSRKKLVRFNENALRRNVIEPGKLFFGTIQNKWNEAFFPAAQDLVLEIGCGHGDYTVEMASLFPERNFVGIDIKGSRIWRGSVKAEKEGLGNVGFLRIPVQNLAAHFGQGEVSEIWITFPDPRPKNRDEKRRLSSPRYLDLYGQVLKPGGLVHLKTDSLFLYDYTLEVLKERKNRVVAQTEDLYQSPLQEFTHGIQTTYEKKFLEEGVPIKYLQFKIGE